MLLLKWMVKMHTHTIKVPTKILLRTSPRTGEEKHFILNLNNYRNTHFRDLSLAKREYAKIIYPLINSISKLSTIELTYMLYRHNKRKVDVNNVLSVVDKFFQDCIVTAGIIEDDNYNFINKTTFSFGGIDHDAPEDYVIIRLIGV